MVLKPNDATSIYKDYETENDTTGDFPDNGNGGTSQPLHFRATLKQDGNIAIEPGILKPPALFRLPTLITLSHRQTTAVRYG